MVTAMALAVRLLIFGATLAAIVAVARYSARDLTLSALPPATGDEYCGQPCDLYQIVWVGDMMLGDAAQAHLDRFGYTWPFDYVRPMLAADFTIGNAESPITTRRQQYFPKQKWHYNVQPQAARALADVGFDALGLSNNHALDRGPSGLRDTMWHAQEAGLRTFGAGMNIDEASAPLLVETRHGTIGIVGLSTKWIYGAVATSTRAGTIPLTDAEITRLKQVATAAGARWVVAYVHWGENYEGITSRQRAVAASFARAGYDLVIGTHPHIAQEIEIVNGMPVLYSLGNFAFESPGRFNGQMPGVGLVARAYVSPSGFQAVELSCVVTDNAITTYQLRPCTEAQSQTLMRRLGPQVTIRGSKGLLVWR
jgi:poly-gamma-glutamate synthesis protein (capsule biosynthesis protein)